MQSLPLSDEERSELLFLRDLVKIQEDEIQMLKDKLCVYEGNKEFLNKVKNKNFSNDFSLTKCEKEIKNLCSEIHDHRVEVKGKCWYFGIKGLDFDYGSIWSDPDYWKSLIKSNVVNKDFCLFNFHFAKNKQVCSNCNKTVDALNTQYLAYLENLRKKYDLNND